MKKTLSMILILTSSLFLISASTVQSKLSEETKMRIEGASIGMGLYALAGYSLVKSFGIEVSDLTLSRSSRFVFRTLQGSLFVVSLGLATFGCQIMDEAANKLKNKKA